MTGPAPNGAPARRFMLGDVEIDAVDLASRGNAILGIRDSGKSYTATWLAERLLDAGIPFIAFDPIGVWRWLRHPRVRIDGRSVVTDGQGYPVVVAGGAAGDLPLSVEGIGDLVRAAMTSGVSLVIDLFDRRLSKADWRRIVLEAVRVLLHENARHGLRHVFLEEASEFVPQKVADGQLYAAIEQLARMGGNCRLGYTLINQRAAEVNKAVLDLCDNLFLHRQKGARSIDGLKKWLELGDVTDSGRIVASLATLPTGTCWAWMGQADHAVRVEVPAKASLHPDRRMMQGAGDEVEAAAPRAVDVAGFVETMLAAIAAAARAKAEAAGKEKARAEKARAEKAQTARESRPGDLPDVAAPAPAPSAPDPAMVAAAESRGREAGYAEGYDAAKRLLERAAAPVIRRISDALAGLQHDVNLISGIVARPAVPDHHHDDVADDDDRAVAAIPASPTWRAPPAPGPAPAGKLPVGKLPTGKLPTGETAILTACAQHRLGCTREQLTILCGYKRSTRDAYIQRLREREHVAQSGDRITATPSGMAALGPDFRRLPTGRALQQHWLGRLPEGERRILELVLARWPEGLPRSDLDGATGYSRSTRDAYVQRLSARALVAAPAPGMIRAAATLFD